MLRALLIVLSSLLAWPAAGSGPPVLRPPYPETLTVGVRHRGPVEMRLNGSSEIYERFFDEGAYLGFILDGTLVYLPGYHEDLSEQWGFAIVDRGTLIVEDSSNGFFTTVPEPGAAAAFGLVSLALGRRRGRR